MMTNFHVDTHKRGTYNITEYINQSIHQFGLKQGLCNLFIPHTSCSLIICENADPQVKEDLETFLSGLIIDGDPRFKHTAEGADDMPAHIRSILTQVSLSIPVQNRQLALGTWQDVYLYEHRTRPHRRNVMITLLSIE